jgi:hypothetical protein
LDGAPSPGKPGNTKSYDRKRRNMAHFIGMDFLFTESEYLQSLQTDDQGRTVLVNSTRNGKLLSVREAPSHFLEKVWFTRKLRRPREYLGISKIEERVKKLSYLVHVLTQHGFPTRAIAKSVYRLSLTWMFSRFEDMRKHVSSITRKVTACKGPVRSPWESTRDLPRYPCFHGEITHSHGIVTPLWSRPNSSRRR